MTGINPDNFENFRCSLFEEPEPKSYPKEGHECANCGHDEDRHIFRDMGICLDCPCKAYKPKKVKSNHSSHLDRGKAEELSTSHGDTPEGNSKIVSNMLEPSGDHSLTKPSSTASRCDDVDGDEPFIGSVNLQDKKDTPEVLAKTSGRASGVNNDPTGLLSAIEDVKRGDYDVLTKGKPSGTNSSKSNHSPQSKVGQDGNQKASKVLSTEGTNSSGCVKDIEIAKEIVNGALEMALKKEMIRDA